MEMDEIKETIKKLSAVYGQVDEEAAEKIKEYTDEQDQESAHINADELLCDLLRVHFPESVKAFEAMDKWYA